MADSRQLRKLMQQLNQADDQLGDLSDAAIEAEASGNANARQSARVALRNHLERIKSLQALVEAERKRLADEN